MERRIKHDNLKGKHLKKILNPDILFLKKDNIKICNQCEFRYCCFDCRPDSINEDYTEKPWYCTYNPYKAEWANKDLFIDSIINST